MSLLAIFTARENNVIKSIRDLTTISETGDRKAKMKKNTLGYKHPAKKTETQHILSSVLKPSMSSLDRGKIFMGSFILAIVMKWAFQFSLRRSTIC